ncbi:MAG: hypothetical protein Q4C46_06795 [Bacillota bacterium]|nr:hypothetical protein [Bacillota bacterium]
MAQYPKPLSEKSIAKLYDKAGLNEKKISFLHDFFTAAANLYGAFPVAHIWEVYKELSEKIEVPKLKRKEIVEAAGIMRRESMCFYVFEIDELYSKEKRSELNREVVHKDLINVGYGKYMLYYRFCESQNNVPYYVPEDFLRFKRIEKSNEEKALLKFIGNLVVENDSFTDRYNDNVCPCKAPKGRKLKSFSFMNRHEEFELRYAKGEIQGNKGRPDVVSHLTKEYSCSEAEKIVRTLKRNSSYGVIDSMAEIKGVFDELNEVGVSLTQAKSEKLLGLINDFHNNSHHMCIRGWKPVELAARREIPTAISFGPRIKKAIAEGKMDKEELIEGISSIGFNYVE